MSIILITLGSLFLIAFVAHVARKIFGWEICAICAGVSGTWLWMLVGVLTDNLRPTLAGQATYNFAIAILMGGSVVGIAYQGETRLPAGRSALAWKMVCIPLGFAGVLALLQGLWAVSAGAFAIPVAAWVMFFSMPPQSGELNERKGEIDRIKNQMKNCC